MPAKANNGLSSDMANQVGVLRGLVSSHSQKLDTGTRQRQAGPSQRRQCGLFVLRMFVTVWPPNAGGPGMPQHIMVSQADWSRPLTRSLQINRTGPGIKLGTLADARAFLLDHFGGTIIPIRALLCFSCSEHRQLTAPCDQSIVSVIIASRRISR